MKKIVNSIWTILVLIGEARHATYLVRQGRVSEVRAMYGK